MSPSDKNGDAKGHKTLALRLDDERHARLSIIAQLRDSSLTEEIRQAIDAYIAHVGSSPELTAKAEAVLAAIDREASSRRAAIAAMLSPTDGSGESTASEPASRAASRRTRGDSPAAS